MAMQMACPGRHGGMTTTHTLLRSRRGGGGGGGGVELSLDLCTSLSFYFITLVYFYHPALVLFLYNHVRVT